MDYKILTKVLSARIKKLLNEIIKIDQVGYLKGRYIGEAIRLVDDMIFHTTYKHISGYLLTIDFEKAFDSVSHQFLQIVLSYFGFGPSFHFNDGLGLCITMLKAVFLMVTHQQVILTLGKG